MEFAFDIQFISINLFFIDKENYCDYQGLICVVEARIPEVIIGKYKTEENCIESCIEMEINNLG